MARDEGSGLGGRGAALLDKDEVLGVLSGSFYTPRSEAEPPAPAASSSRLAAKSPPPTHYKVICISLYTKDLERLDEMVDALKAEGVTKANRSALIRAALDQVDLSKVPRGM
jgi:hypothetical protein